MSKTRYPEPEVMLTDPMSGFQIVKYFNGSFSMKDPLTGQVMHSMIGPQEESSLLYAEASGIVRRLQQGDIVLWDVGMGTGANVTASLDAIVQAGVDSARLTVFSFENDLRALRFMLAHLEYFGFLEKYAAMLQALLDQGHIQRQLSTAHGSLDFEWHVLEGDFYERFASTLPPDLIFFDFYAPAAVPQLWTEQGFSAMRRFIGDKDCILHTYAAATPIRLNLLLAGFFVGYGPRTRMKTDTTVAATRLDLLEQPLGASWQQKLRVSSAIADEAQRASGLRHLQFEMVRDNGNGQP